MTHGVVVESPIVGSTAPAPEPKPYTGPDYIPEKFRSAEDPVKAMAEAYAEAEKKISGSTPADPNATPADPNATPADPNAVAPAGLAKFAAEYEKEGKLSDASYTELEKLGIDRTMVDTYLDGVGAIVERNTNQLHESVGGKDTYEQMIAWGLANLPEAERQAYDTALQSGDMSKITAEAKAIKAKFEAANGVNPQVVVEGNRTAVAIGGYASRAELTRDQMDPRYRDDPVFRDQVEKRALKSNF